MNSTMPRRRMSGWAFAAGAIAALVGLVTCARLGQAGQDPVAAHLRDVAARHVAFLKESGR